MQRLLGIATPLTLLYCFLSGRSTRTPIRLFKSSPAFPGLSDLNFQKLNLTLQLQFLPNASYGLSLIYREPATVTGALLRCVH